MDRAGGSLVSCRAELQKSSRSELAGLNPVTCGLDGSESQDLFSEANVRIPCGDESKTRGIVSHMMDAP